MKNEQLETKKINKDDNEEYYNERDYDENEFEYDDYESEESS